MTQTDITYQEKINELRLDFSHPNTQGITFILVEGKSDIRLFRKLFKAGACKVEGIPGGMAKLEEAINELIVNYDLVIGIRDADFNHLENTSPSSPRLFQTDFHDIEMGAISVDHIIHNILHELTESPENEHASIRNAVFNCLEQVSLMKWLNIREHIKLNFSGAGFQDLVNCSNLQLNFATYMTRVFSKSPDATITNLTTLLSKINVLRQQNPDPLQLCNGHDFIKSLSKFIREKGTVKSVSEDVISSILRINYTVHDFKVTKLCEEIIKWAETKNVELIAA